jgi:apolipoprotein N-acyltransferase
MKKNTLYLSSLSLLSGVLLWMGWGVGGYFLFVAFLPLLEIDVQLKPKEVKRAKLKFFGYVYLACFVWNVLTTWWLVNSTIVGVSAAVFINSLFMTVPFLMFRSTKLALNEKYGYISLFLYWLGFEYLHLNWDLSWTWLNLGNAFASLPSWVQWYDITGVLGGTAWVLAMNIFIFLAIKSYFPVVRKTFTIYALLTFFLVYGGSLLRYYSYEESGKEVEIAVIQPNIDPYQEKFASGKNYISPLQQIDRMIQLSEKVVSPQTQFLILPEASLADPSGIYAENVLQQGLKLYPSTAKIATFLQKYPQLCLLAGASTYLQYAKEETPTTRYKEGVGYYDVFNAAMFANEKQNIQFYHKSKLVIGVETIPFPDIFQPLIMNFGGATGRMGTQKERSVFKNKAKIGIAPLICYESIFGAYTLEYIQKEAHILCIITNDAWWGNTPGHRQHFDYARLRAIETRRSVAHCANTGISGFINQRGDVIQKSKYDESIALKGMIKANTQITTYTKNGDWIGRIASFLSVIMFLIGFVKKKTKKK